MRWKQRLLFVQSVPLAACAEVFESRTNGVSLFPAERTFLLTLCYLAENPEEILDPPMAIPEHAQWIVESGIRPRADLNRHVSSPPHPFACLHFRKNRTEVSNEGPGARPARWLAERHFSRSMRSQASSMFRPTLN